MYSARRMSSILSPPSLYKARNMLIKSLCFLSVCLSVCTHAQNVKTVADIY
jgi:hypothetical protein